MKVNDKVMFSAQFCRSIFESSGDIPHARGIITKLAPVDCTGRDVTIAHVDWDLLVPGKVLTSNLTVCK